MDGSARLAYKIFTPDSTHLVHKIHHNENLNKVNEKIPPVILLHGITNTKETWDDCGPIIASKTGTTVYSLDARNHGDSEWTDKISYINMADDVAHFMDSMAIPTSIIIGHSMGGKTAMCFALRHPHRLHSMVIEDMSLNVPQSAVDSTVEYMVQLREILHKIPPKTDLLEAKRIAARHLSLDNSNADQAKANVWDGRHLPLALKEGGKGYKWRTNLDAILGSVSRDEFTPANLLEGTETDPDEAVYNGPVLLIYGTCSPMSVLNDKGTFLKKFPSTVYKPVEGANHSIHTEYPDTFVELVSNFILKHNSLKSHI